MPKNFLIDSQMQLFFKGLLGTKNSAATLEFIQNNPRQVREIFSTNKNLRDNFVNMIVTDPRMKAMGWTNPYEVVSQLLYVLRSFEEQKIPTCFPFDNPKKYVGLVETMDIFSLKDGATEVKLPEKLNYSRIYGFLRDYRFLDTVYVSVIEGQEPQTEQLLKVDTRGKPKAIVNNYNTIAKYTKEQIREVQDAYLSVDDFEIKKLLSPILEQRGKVIQENTKLLTSIESNKDCDVKELLQYINYCKADDFYKKCLEEGRQDWIYINNARNC